LTPSYQFIAAGVMLLAAPRPLSIRVRSRRYDAVFVSRAEHLCSQHPLGKAPVWRHPEPGPACCVAASW